MSFKINFITVSFFSFQKSSDFFPAYIQLAGSVLFVAVDLTAKLVYLCPDLINSFQNSLKLFYNIYKSQSRYLKIFIAVINLSLKKEVAYLF